MCRFDKLDASASFVPLRLAISRPDWSLDLMMPLATDQFE